MSTISTMQENISNKNQSADIYKNKYLVAMKGAPEVVYNLLKNPPTYFHDTVNKLTSQGNRVLALAYKLIDKNVDVKIKTYIEINYL